MPPLLLLAGLLHAMWRESIHLVQEGIASPADIDRVARLTFGLRLPAMGPLENMDSKSKQRLAQTISATRSSDAERCCEQSWGVRDPSSHYGCCRL